MKGRSVIVLILGALFLAAALYFFFFTEHSEGLILEGIVDANQVVVSPKVQGILERLNVDEGSSVRAGELIATLDTAELDANVEADRASVANLRSQLAQSQSNYQMALHRDRRRPGRRAGQAFGGQSPTCNNLYRSSNGFGTIFRGQRPFPRKEFPPNKILIIGLPTYGLSRPP